MQEITIDAKNKSLGRLASEISFYLQGKHLPDYDPSVDRNIFVKLKNWKAIKFTGNKLITKLYYRHTGYIGHLKKYTLKEVWQKNPLKVIQLAVKRMLPKNRLASKRILRIKLENE